MGRRSHRARRASLRDAVTVKQAATMSSAAARQPGRKEGRSAGSHNARRRGNVPASLPRVPLDFFCHICFKNHWTVECPRLQAQPEAYPLMDRERGCWRCGQRGHTAVQCQIRKYRCRECGGVHDTRDCAYAHVGEEWHEFFDRRTWHVFYTNADDSEVQWQPPTHELDWVLWYCSSCGLMIPSKYMECLKCHAPRPLLLQEQKRQDTQAFSSSSSGGDGSSSDDEDDSGSSSSTGKSNGDDDDEAGSSDGQPTPRAGQRA